MNTGDDIQQITVTSEESGSGARLRSVPGHRVGDAAGDSDSSVDDATPSEQADRADHVGRVSAKKATAKKATAKKATAKKSTAKKSTAKKATAKKSVRGAASRLQTAEAVSVAPPPTADPAPAVDAAPAATDAPDFDDLWGGDWDDFSVTDEQPAKDAPSDPFRASTVEGVELLHHAARELISAARYALDTAEELLEDPRAIGVALESLRDIAAEVVRSAKPVGRGRVSTERDHEDDFETIRVDDD